MALTHNSETADSEPTWSSVNKTNLPDSAFADRESRRYPHHWVRNGGDPDDDGRYTTGEMFLHKGGLNAAWSAAQGARSGEDASDAIKSHLSAHRHALGLDKEENAAIPTDPGPESLLAHVQAGRVILAPVDAATRSAGREYDCVFLTPGRVMKADGTESDWIIPPEPVKAAAPLFNALSSFLDHPEMFGFGWHQAPQVKNLVGVTFDPRWSDDEQALLGGIRLYDQEPGSPGAFVGALMDQMLADREAGRPVPQTGLSAVFFQRTNLNENTGLTATTEISHVESVDFVYSPGARGYVRAALEAIRDDHRVWFVPQSVGGNTMPHTSMTPPNTPNAGSTAAPPTLQPEPQDATASLTATLTHDPRLDSLASQIEALTSQVTALTPAPGMSASGSQVEPPQPAPDRLDQILSRLDALTPEPDPVPDPEEERLEAIEGQLELLTATLAAREEETTIEGVGQPQVLRGAIDSLDQVKIALDALLDGVLPADGRVPPLRGVREFYELLSGDWEMTGLFHGDRVYLANVTSSTMAKLTADALNKRVVQMYANYPLWWEPIVRPENFQSLQTIKWITLGGIGELPTVAEGAAYTELTIDDIEQQSTFVKKGGYLGVTLESIDKDDTRTLRAMPGALAQAAWLTLSKSISEIFTANSGVGPNIYYDNSNTRALFHASNGNLGSTALSWAAWVATRTAMRQQTETNSGERLGALTAPVYCLVPSDLEMAALQYLASAGEPGTADNDINPEAQGEGREERLRRARERVIVVDLWTDTNNWAAVCNPQLWPTIGLGFRYGSTPEIFSVASPTAGLMFSNDVMPIKVRFFFATGPMDWRGMYKHNVG